MIIRARGASSANQNGSPIGEPAPDLAPSTCPYEAVTSPALHCLGSAILASLEYFQFSFGFQEFKG